MKKEKIQCRIDIKRRNDIDVYIKKRSLFSLHYNDTAFLLEAIDEKLFSKERWYKELIKKRREFVAGLQILRDEIHDLEKEIENKAIYGKNSD